MLMQQTPPHSPSPHFLLDKGVYKYEGLLSANTRSLLSWEKEKVKDHILMCNCPLKHCLTMSHETILSEIQLCTCEGQNTVIFIIWYEATCSSVTMYYMY